MIAKTENKTITTTKELIDYATKNHLNRYYGFDELNPIARLTGISNPEKLLIRYDSMIECKSVEAKLKKICITFTPKQYDTSNTSIRASNVLKAALRELNKDNTCSVSFESIIWDLIVEHYDDL